MIPEKWSNCLSNASGKKIVLFDSFLCLAQKDEKDYLDQLQGTVEAFFEKRDDVLLIWFCRDYTKIGNQLSELGKTRYREIIDQYEMENWGIFAEETEWNSAKNIADFYYGNDMAKVLMFASEGKEAMLQNHKVIYWLETLVEDNDFFWTLIDDVSDKGIGLGLFKIDKETSNVKYITTPDEFLKSRSFSKIMKKDQKLYFIPLVSDYLAIYDIIENDWEKVPITTPEYRVFYSDECKFITGEFFENNLYMFSFCYPMIARYDIVSKKVEYLYQCTEKWIAQANIGYYFAFKTFTIDTAIVFYSQILNRILCFDLESAKLNCILDLKDYPVCDLMEYKDGKCWLYVNSDNGTIIEYNIKRKELHSKMLGISNICLQEGAFLHSHIEGDVMWLLPGLSEQSIKINLVTGETKAALEFDLGINGTRLSKFWMLLKTQETLYVWYSKEEKIVIYNFETGNSKSKKLNLYKEEAYIRACKLGTYLVCKENLRKVELIRDQLGIVSIKEKTDSYSSGKHIWEACE